MHEITEMTILAVLNEVWRGGMKEAGYKTKLTSMDVEEGEKELTNLILQDRERVLKGLSSHAYSISLDKRLTAEHARLMEIVIDDYKAQLNKEDKI